MAPTVRLAVLVAAIGVGGLFLPLGLTSALWVVAFAAAALDARLVGQPPTVARVLRPLARNVPAPFSIEVVPSADTRRARRITIRQPQPPDIHLEPSHAEGMTLEGTIIARRRGIHALPNVAVRFEGPLGLATVVHEVGPTGSVTVHPDLPTAHRLAMMFRRGLLQADGRNRGPLGLGTEFEAVREYRTDDDVRQINWLATSRTGRAMSTVYRQEDERDLVICVDTGRLTAGSFAGSVAGTAGARGNAGTAGALDSEALASTTRLDVLFDVVAALALVADEVGDRVGFLAYDDRQLTRLTPRRRGGQGVVNAALRLEPHPVDADHSISVLRLPAVRRSIVVLCTELLDMANSGALIASVARLHAAHDVTVVTALDPAVERARRDGSPTLQQAAKDLVADRAEVVRGLQACGAQVISAEPHALAATATRAYLSARSGRKPKRHTSAQ